MMLKIINDIAKEVAIKTQERLRTEGGDLQTIISEELVNEVQKKSRKLTDQSKASDLNKNNFETIIAPGEGIDNGEIYNEDTGVTIRDLDYKGECICQK